MLLLRLLFYLVVQEVAWDDDNGDFVDTVLSSQSDRYDHRGAPGVRPHSNPHSCSHSETNYAFINRMLQISFFFPSFAFLHVFLILHMHIHILTHPEFFIFNPPPRPLLFQKSPRGGADGLRGHVQPHQPRQLRLQPGGRAAAGHGTVSQSPGGGGDQEKAGGRGAGEDTAAVAHREVNPYPNPPFSAPP